MDSETVSKLPSENNTSREIKSEYFQTKPHSLNRGDGLGEEVTIQGDVYKIEVNDKGHPRLLRYNTKYRIWVSVEFMGNSVDLEKSVQNLLKGQYVRRVLESLKE